MISSRILLILNNMLSFESNKINIWSSQFLMQFCFKYQVVLDES